MRERIRAVIETPVEKFLRFPMAQWKALRTTNALERIHEEFGAG